MKYASVALCFAGVINIANCASQRSLDSYAYPGYSEAIDQLGVPQTIDGDVDTAWEYYLTLRTECGGVVELCELYDRAVVDTYLGQVLVSFIGQKVEDASPPGIPNSRFQEIQTIISAEHTAWLDSIIEKVGWFSIDRYGHDADKAAFLLVQHSADTHFQNQLLQLLVPLAEAGNSDLENAALLADRIAIKTGTLQTFGTQGRCLQDGQWRPFPTTDPASLDERRAAMQLAASQQYNEKMSVKYCNRKRD